MNLALGKFDEAVEMRFVAALEERIEQHRAQGRAKRKSQPRVHAVAQPAIHDLDERQVTFGDRFEEPVFLEKLFVLWMPHERQVRVQDQGEITLRTHK